MIDRDMERAFKRLGIEIRRRREALNMSLEDVSAITCLTPSTLQRIENGQYDLTLLDLGLIAVALRCEAHELLADDDDVMTGWMSVTEAEAEDADKPTPRRYLN
jgi:transcriptional regulator with XRE-family HTH domain